MIEVTYDIEQRTGLYKDNAGGMAEDDVYKVFIPGETSNRDYSQAVIGSFGMGAKKGIFCLSDGAKVVSCRSASEGSFTSEVPEKWELEPSWETLDGRAAAIEPGCTMIYLFRLFDPPTLEEINQLIVRTGAVYGPLLNGDLLSKRVEIKVNGLSVAAAPGINWSGAKGAGPRIYKFQNTFPNFLDRGQDITLEFLFKCGLTRYIPGEKLNRESGWGIDIYGNGRQIEQFIKRPFFGSGKRSETVDADKPSENTSGSKYFRGQVFISGHSFAIPWDTHKREYLRDHLVAQWLSTILVPVIKRHVAIAGRFASQGATNLRHAELEGKAFNATPPENALPTDGPAPDSILPKWEYGSIARPKKKPSRTAAKSPDSASETNNPASNTLQDATGDASANGNGDQTEEDRETDVKTVTLELNDGEFGDLVERFGVDTEDGLASAIRECLFSGVAFTLDAEQLNKLLGKLRCDNDLGRLSSMIRDELLRKAR